MAAIKALEGRTVHQIQSGQVIVDLCSVVKELVENSLDAGATFIEVRFKHNGLDSVEVQDNGVGISRENYESIALKHYTSKLSDYDDLSSLQTFGFRGEALSSLCALSKFHISTARAEEAPKGSRLDFEPSGKLKSNQVIACQKGTVVTVEDIFRNLPVRRRELEKNVKREYGKALSVLQAYACISTQTRISVSNIMAKGNKVVAFATRLNPNTRENIANVFGAKALHGLVAMDLNFEMQATRTFTQLSKPDNKQVQIIGHVSRPSLGEGRSAPDRQMFYVNARPCNLPQVAKVFNEVYKTYNLSQSPFVLANIILDTNAYDVNVSPDKRMILLHEQTALLESLREALVALFEKQDHTVPQSQVPVHKLPLFKQLTVHQEDSEASRTTLSKRSTSRQDAESNQLEVSKVRDPPSPKDTDQEIIVPSILTNFACRDSRERVKQQSVVADMEIEGRMLSRDKQKLINKLSREDRQPIQRDQHDKVQDLSASVDASIGTSTAVDNLDERIADRQSACVSYPDLTPSSSADPSSEDQEEAVHGIGQLRPASTPGIVPNTYNRMRSRRSAPEVASITIGSETTTSMLGSGSPLLSYQRKTATTPSATVKISPTDKDPARDRFSSSIRSFVAPGSQLIETVGRSQSNPCVFVSHTKAIEGENRSDDNSSVGPTVSDGEASDHEGESSVPGAHEHGTRGSTPSGAKPDDNYLDEKDKKSQDNAQVAALIRQAEERQSASITLSDRQSLRTVGQRDITTHLIQMIDTSFERISQLLTHLDKAVKRRIVDSTPLEPQFPVEGDPLEERLLLTVTKSEFTDMQIIGQFNLGFILATRDHSDLFIIDQHASDEKINFERLQATTVVQNQRLVHSRALELTAVEEEIILENSDALLKNGFAIDVDTSGTSPVGRRCRLVSLPMSREVTFDITDLEELIALLAESPISFSSKHVPRPSKVRRMFAMRACRSSVMIGKTLTLKQMEAQVRKMGEIDKPWNCPHGRPTMRHLSDLRGWRGWRESDGLTGMEEGEECVDWSGWITGMKANQQHSRYEEEEGEGSEGLGMIDDDRLGDMQDPFSELDEECEISADEQEVEDYLG